jgi:hypothetical protein
MWLPLAAPGARGAFSLRDDADGAAHGERYQRVTHAGGAGAVGIANYGLNCQHGMVFEAGEVYEGHSYVRAHGEHAVDVTIAMHDWVRNVTLASMAVQLEPGRGWERVPITLTPSENTFCTCACVNTCGRCCGHALHFWADAFLFACARSAAMTAETPFGKRDDLATCSGRLIITTDTEDAVLDVDLTMLSPGEWGTEPAPWAGTLGARAAALRVAGSTLCVACWSLIHSAQLVWRILQDCPRDATWWTRYGSSSSAFCAWAARCATWKATAGAHSVAGNERLCTVLCALFCHSHEYICHLN